MNNTVYFSSLRAYLDINQFDPELQNILTALPDNLPIENALQQLEPEKMSKKTLTALFSFVVQSQKILERQALSLQQYAQKITTLLNTENQQQESYVNDPATSEESLHNKNLPLFQVPRDVLLEILRYLENDALFSFFLTSKEWMPLRPLLLTERCGIISKIFVNYLAPSASSRIKKNELPPNGQLLEGIKAHFCHIRALTLSNDKYTSDLDIEYIVQKFPNVEKLGACSNSISNFSLHLLQKLQYLHTLSWDCTSATEASFDLLIRLPRLRKLTLVSYIPNFDTNLIKKLKDSKQLKTFSLRGLMPYQDNYEFLPSLSQIETLYLGASTSVKFSFAYLKNMPSLQTLKIRCSAMNTTDLQYVKRLENLRRLILKGFPRITEKDIQQLLTEKPGLQVIKKK